MISDNYDYCYETGNYEDECCELCPHKSDCSGYTGDTYEDDDE